MRGAIDNNAIAAADHASVAENRAYAALASSSHLSPARLVVEPRARVPAWGCITARDYTARSRTRLLRQCVALARGVLRSSVVCVCVRRCKSTKKNTHTHHQSAGGWGMQLPVIMRLAHDAGTRISKLIAICGGIFIGTQAAVYGQVYYYCAVCDIRSSLGRVFAVAQLNAEHIIKIGGSAAPNIGSC